MSRSNRAALLAGGVAAALLLAYVALWLGVSRLEIGRSDFTSTYVGATLLRQGHGTRLYDETLQAPLHARLIAPGDHEGNLPFVNPPGAALLALPVSPLDLPAAYRVWSLFQLALLGLAVAVAVRAAPWPPTTPREVRAASWLVGFAGAGAANTLLLGQWDGLLALGVAMAYAEWRRGRPAGAGAWLAAVALLAKPHLFFGVAAFLVGRRDRRAVAGAIAAIAAVGALSLLLVGPHGIADFARISLGGTDRWPLRSLLGFTGLFGAWLGNSASAHTLAAVGSVLALALCAVLGDRTRREAALFEPALAGTIALSLVASPHLLGHDLALLNPAVAWTLAWAAARERTRDWPGATTVRVLVMWILLNCTAALDFGNGDPAPPGRIVPIALAAIGVVAWRYSGRSRGVGGVVAQS
jgi:Glycosyltransferase family 87